MWAWYVDIWLKASGSVEWVSVVDWKNNSRVLIHAFPNHVVFAWDCMLLKFSGLNIITWQIEEDNDYLPGKLWKLSFETSSIILGS